MSFLSCEASVLRGTIRHSHLENAYLTLPPSILHKIITSEDVPSNLTNDMLNKLATIMVDNYSPVNLVNTSPYLDSVANVINVERWKSVLHEKYLQQSEIKALREKLLILIEVFISKQTEFISLVDNQVDFIETYDLLMTASRELRDLLELLPKRIWLP